MAKYDVDHACGHTVAHNLIGPEEGRQSRIAWLETVPCWDCKRAAKVAAAVAANAHLPALAGSEKQFAWAEQIRASALASPHNSLAPLLPTREQIAKIAASHSLSEFDVEERLHGVAEAAQAARTRLTTETSAKWWIDDRDTVEALVKRAFLEAAKAAFAATMARAAEAAAERKAAVQEEAEQRRAAEIERNRQEQAAREEAEAVALREAETFVVADVVVECDNVIVTAADGREALGFVDDTEWGIYSVNGHNGSSLQPEMERIAAAAKALWASPADGALQPQDQI